MRAAEAEGPRWDLHMAFWESCKPGHTTSDKNFISSCLVAFCCQPCRGWLGSGSYVCGRDTDNSVQEGTAMPASSTSLHSRTVWNQGTVPSSRCPNMVSATRRCLCLTMLNASAQLAEWATLVTLKRAREPQSSDRQGQRGEHLCFIRC